MARNRLGAGASQVPPDRVGGHAPSTVGRASARDPRGAGWLLAAALPITITWLLFRTIEPWILMWALAGVLYGTLKVVAWMHGGAVLPRRERWLWFLFWPGMNPREFRIDSAPSPAAPGTPLRRGVVNVAIGLLLLAAAAPASAALHRWAGAWVAMAGFAFVLHFGVFTLLAAGWNRAGRPVRPIMENPVAAVSLGEFWGRRWNRAFSDLSRNSLFRPLAARFGARRGYLAVFVFSGMIHELVITVPAGGAYGLPTLYFLIQAAGLSLQRGATGRKLGLASGWRGRAVTWAFVLLPAGVLFPPPFLDNVVIPFFQTLLIL